MTLRAIARQLLEDTGWDAVEARGRIDAALADPKMRAEIDIFIRTALAREVEDVWTAQRSSYRSQLGKGETSESRIMRAAMERAEQHLMDWPLSPSTGLRLGDASKADLDAWIQQKRRRLQTEEFDLSFVVGVSAALKQPVDTVRAHLKEADLQQLRRKAAREVSAAAVA